MSKEREEVQDWKMPDENSESTSAVEARETKEEGHRWEESGGEPEWGRREANRRLERRESPCVKLQPGEEKVRKEGAALCESVTKA